ncbi:MAG: MFS transporter [Trueperaceae bacterium]|nr:MFS transporter [Trueperaceae bacterium]
MTNAAGPGTPEATPTAPDPALRGRHARRITGALFVSQSLGSAGSIAAATVAAIVGAELSGSVAWAGLPGALTQVGIALGALAWSRASDRIGRRGALSGALLTGALGALLSLFGVASGNFALVLVGLFVGGSGNAGVQLGRFVAAEVNPKARRARALATVVLGGTFGSVVGPLLVGPTSALVTTWGWNEIAGPYLATGVGYFLTAILLFTSLRPEPRLIGEAIAREERGPAAATAPARDLPQLLRDPSVRTAIASVVTAHMVMVGLMQMTSLHMHGLAHPLTSIAIVFSSHTFGMFAFSMVSGWLADRWGRRPVLGLGATITLLSCLMAPLSPELLPLSVALFLLGLGWNLCYVAGSALLSDALAPSEKGRMQGFNDLLVGGAAAAATLLGGWVMAGPGGYTTMGLLGAAATAPLLLVVARLPKGRPAAA